MPVVYEEATPEVNVFVVRVMQRYHTALADLEPTVDILFALPPVDGNGDPTGTPALKHHGHKAYATIRQTRPDERALGQADIHIKIDRDDWDTFDEEERTALIDHEFAHLSPKLKRGAVKRDSYDRPLFITNYHDYEVGWFFAVARRHGRKSIECRQLQELMISDDYRECMAASITPATVVRRRVSSRGEL